MPKIVTKSTTTNSDSIPSPSPRFNPLSAPLASTSRQATFKLPLKTRKLLPSTSTSNLVILKKDLRISSIDYPTGDNARIKYVNPETRKGLSDHQWKVFDWILEIPVGKVSTYGLLAKGIGSSAQAVGGSLKSNPFQPYIPCHRIIASTNYIGGFQGEWLKEEGSGKHTTASRGEGGEGGEGEKVNKKLELLKQEGVEFDATGYLIDKGKIWSG